MKNAIILHGIDDTRNDMLSMQFSPSNSHWIPWLQYQLIKHDVLTQTPEMPDPYISDMDYNKWVSVFEQFYINKKTILIGHSCGAGFLLKYLSNNSDIFVDQLILVAPWTDEEQLHPTFLKNFNMDINLPDRIRRIDLFYSIDDDDSIKSSVDRIKQAYANRIICHEFTNKGHFVTGSLKLSEFPELLNVIIK